MTNEWQEFTPDFDYEKDFYEVQLPTGEVVPKCWPNAGKMHATDGTERSWESGVKVRLDLANRIGD